MGDGDEENLSSLTGLAIYSVSSVIYDGWNFDYDAIESGLIDVHELRENYQKYLNFSPEVSFDIIMCMLQNGPLAFGQAVWILESTCHRLYKSWLSGLSLQNLCEVVSSEAKYSIQELLVNSDDDVTDIEFAKCFKNLNRLIISQNNQITNNKVEQILSDCHNVEELSCKGCSGINDGLFSVLWKLQSVQDNLTSLDICSTAVSASMAASLYFLLPHLNLLLYDDISGFLRYRCHTLVHNQNVNFSRKVRRVRLGDTGFQRLRFVNDDRRVCKEMELLLPNYDAEAFDVEGHANVFRFQEDTDVLFRFHDVYKAICSVASHFTLGCCPENSYLNEISLINVRDVDLNAIFSDLRRLKKLSLWHNCSITSFSSQVCVAENLNEVEFWFVASEVVEKTLKHCHNLEYITLRSVTITNETFKNVTFNCLKEVKIYYCEGYSKVANAFQFPTEVEIWHDDWNDDVQDR